MLRKLLFSKTSFLFKKLNLITFLLLFSLFQTSCVNEDPIEIDHDSIERTEIHDFLGKSEKEYRLNDLGVYELVLPFSGEEKNKLRNLDVVSVSYEMKTMDTLLVEKKDEFSFQLGDKAIFPAILDNLFLNRTVGDTISFLIPSSLAYGQKSKDFFEGLNTMRLDVIILGVKTKEQILSIEKTKIANYIEKQSADFDPLGMSHIYFPQKTPKHDTVPPSYKVPLARRVEMNYVVSTIEGNILQDNYKDEKFVFTLGQEGVVKGLKDFYDSLKPNYDFIKPHYDSLAGRYSALAFRSDSLSTHYDTLDRTNLNLRPTYEALSLHHDSMNIHYDSLKRYYNSFSVDGLTEATLILPSDLAYGASVQVIPERFRQGLIGLGVISAISLQVKPFETLVFTMENIKKRTVR